MSHNLQDLVHVKRTFTLFLCLDMMIIAGCFGPITMSHDIDSYNHATINSETEMLVYNIGQLSEHQPTHFMMLASVSQSRTFSGTSSFQWTQALAAINPV